MLDQTIITLPSSPVGRSLYPDSVRRDFVQVVQVPYLSVFVSSVPVRTFQAGCAQTPTSYYVTLQTDRNIA